MDAAARDALVNSADLPGPPALVEAMLRPEFYPERPARVEFRQTHISYVFLAGDSAYKVKKAVRLSFLDCADLASRYHFCREEIRLNRRLAPDVYLGVWPIVRAGKGYALGPAQALEPQPDAVEYAVKMRRLSDDTMLDRLVAAGRADPTVIGAVAARLAEFHAQCSSARGWTYGAAAAIWRLVVGNLTECDRFIGYTIGAGEFATLETYLRGCIAAHWETLNDRVRAHHVVEGHGDLRAEHVSVSRGEIRIIDCVEFSERLRYCDTASELAFLAMDLERLGARELADELVARYAGLSGDEGLFALLPFYKCYRAVVRAKVATLKSLADEVAPDARERSRTAARNHFALALGYATSAAPALVVVCGKSGTGKSTLARDLHQRTGFAVINSDRVRKHMAGIAPDTRVTTGYNQGIYAADFTRRVYDAMLAEARTTLVAGAGVILDATFKDPADRRAALSAAAQAGVPVLFVECRADDVAVMRRLRDRAARAGEVSDATVSTWRRQSAEFVPVDEVPKRNRMVADTSRDAREIVLDVQRALTRVQGGGDCAGG
jgi:uncharacterized protein